MTSLNPHSSDATDEQERRAITKASIGYGFVTNQDPEAGEVTIQPIGEGSADGGALSFTAKTSVVSKGDIAIPKSGDEPLYALYARVNDDIPYVLGYYYDEDEFTMPESSAGERKIGHQLTDSEIYFQEDGTILIESDGSATIELRADGTVVINNGNNGLITDVSTSKDADGHVTDVSLTRNNDILV